MNASHRTALERGGLESAERIGERAIGRVDESHAEVAAANASLKTVQEILSRHRL